LLEFWEFVKFFVRDLYANPAFVEIGEFQTFSVSVTWVFSVLMTGSTPAASTNSNLLQICLFFSSLEIQTENQGKTV
jgi:hypothetical protein